MRHSSLQRTGEGLLPLRAGEQFILQEDYMSSQTDKITLKKAYEVDVYVNDDGYLSLDDVDGNQVLLTLDQSIILKDFIDNQVKGDWGSLELSSRK
jgi:hypothetical protein